MRIVLASGRLLVLRKYPWAITLPLYGAATLIMLHGAVGPEIEQLSMRALIIAGGVWLFWVASAWFPMIEIVFDREAGVLEHRIRTLFGMRSEVVGLGKIRRATIEANSPEALRRTRLVLETEDGTLPLEPAFQGGDRRALAAAVNEWLSRAGGSPP